MLESTNAENITNNVTKQESNVCEPVHYLETDIGRTLEDGTALCLSGGGYRAMLFHIGVLWRLNEIGWLPKLDRISSVSGGFHNRRRIGNELE